jgi:hypothetical protein
VNTVEYTRLQNDQVVVPDQEAMTDLNQSADRPVPEAKEPNDRSLSTENPKSSKQTPTPKTNLKKPNLKKPNRNNSKSN